jgi:nucleoid DNA-binding protein
MRHSDLLQKCADRTGVSLPVVKLVVTTLFEEILIALSLHKRVKISKFGIFELRKKKNSESAGYIKISQVRLVKKLFELLKNIGDTKNGKKS